MGKVLIARITKLAYQFEALAQSSDNRIVSKFYTYLEGFLNIELSMDDVMSWLDSNKTVLGGKLNRYWHINENGDLISYIEPPTKAVVISKSSAPSKMWKDYSVVESSVLRPAGKIPALYLNVYDDDEISFIPKEIAHDEFLVKALNILFFANRYPVEDTVKFFNDNRDKINKIRSLFSGQPKFLDSGADGVAFALGNNFILKIFKYEHSFEEAKKAMQRLHDHPELAKTEAMIYDVGIIGQFNDQNVYYYIMEQMTTLTNIGRQFKLEVEKIAIYITSVIGDIKGNYLRPLKDQIEDPSKYKEIQNSVKNLAKAIAGQIKIDLYKDISFIEGYVGLRESPSTKLKQEDLVKSESKHSTKLDPNWLTLFVEEMIMKYLTSRTDLHMGNLGVTQYGELRYFDPAHQYWLSAINQ